MSKVRIPDKNYSKDIISQVRTLINNVKEVSNDYERKCIEVNNIYKKLQKDEITNILKNIPIERLYDAGKGFKLTPFTDRGYKSVYDILKMDFKKMTQLRGVGSITGKRIKLAADAIERSVKKEYTLKFDTDQKSEVHSKLLNVLFYIKSNKEVIDLSKEIKASYFEELALNLKLANASTSKFKWIFLNETKKRNSIFALNRLKNDLNINSIIKFTEKYQQYKTKIKDLDKASIWFDYEQYAPKYYTILEEILDIKFENKTFKGNLPEELVEMVEALELNKTLLKSSLRGYQEFGAKYAIVQKKVLIGDEMGLGKTVESIATIAHLKSQGGRYFIVLCPASVLINWSKEIEKHSKLNSIILHGYDRDLKVEEWIAKGGVGITTYETLQKLDISLNSKLDMLIVDEAHYVKNPVTQRSRAVANLALKSENIIFLTGTPIENNVNEMINLINYLQPEVSKKLTRTNNLINSKEFKLKIAPVYLRRNQKDVLNELPELIQVEEWVKQSVKEEKNYYQAVEQGNFMAMRQAAWKEANRKDSPKLSRLLEICEEAKENGYKIIIFSFFRNTLDIVKSEIGTTCEEPITGSVTPLKRQEIVDKFTSAPAGTVLLSQIGAGGVGLNIQAANVVIFCEPQIKPALECQAIARAYRMGQTKKVIVHRLLSENSIDERMMKMLYNKQKVFDQYARDSVVVEKSSEAKDATEKSVIDKIIAEEKQRLGIQ